MQVYIYLAGGEGEKEVTFALLEKIYYSFSVG